MEGISKERLQELLLKGCASNLIDINLVTKIICEYKELNPWLPIEQALKDRRILLFYPTFGQATGQWNEELGWKSYSQMWCIENQAVFCF